MINSYLKPYFRKTIANTEGSVCHDGDCHFWNFSICTCGLLHQLAIEDEEEIKVNYPKYWDEQAKQERALDGLAWKNLFSQLENDIDDMLREDPRPFDHAITVCKNIGKEIFPIIEQDPTIRIAAFVEEENGGVDLVIQSQKTNRRLTFSFPASGDTVEGRTVDEDLNVKSFEIELKDTGSFAKHSCWIVVEE